MIPQLTSVLLRWAGFGVIFAALYLQETNTETSAFQRRSIVIAMTTCLASMVLIA